MQISKHESTKNLKITYLLGAGASFNSVPILNKQADFLVEVSNHISDKAHLRTDTSKENVYFTKEESQFLQEVAGKMAFYGLKAGQFGSIDIYARKLYLLEDFKELNNLKFCLSIYFDLWERYLCFGQKIKENKFYTRIDKRYYSLLSVILEKNGHLPKLNSNVSFLSWNYDLQLESAYGSFLKSENNPLERINDGFSFFGNTINEGLLDIIHLNGFSGVYHTENKIHELVERDASKGFRAYLKELAQYKNDLVNRNITFENSIKYAWENESKILESAKKRMMETNVLIVIGYSFPSFNRKIDSALINEFTRGSGVKKLVYQDPEANMDIVNSIFQNLDKNDVTIEKENINQFYMPHEFLFPTEGEDFTF